MSSIIKIMQAFLSENMIFLKQFTLKTKSKNIVARIIVQIAVKTIVVKMSPIMKRIGIV